ncbi:MAG: hypothetical protein LC799_11050 [Actinobacteria bacterium]|nr:hypothetical protein [Actinomycetota bacterium]
MALTALLIPVIPGIPSAHADVVDGTCVATVTINFDPPAKQPIPLTPAPHATSTGSGTMTTCAVSDGGATSGTFTYSLEGNLTCTSAQNVTGTLDVDWADNTHSHATVTSLLLDLGSAGGAAGLTATVTTGRFDGDHIQIANLRDPTALIACLTTGLEHATGVTSMTFTQPG